MSTFAKSISLATLKSLSTPATARRLLAVVMLVAALAFSGCAMNDHYTPISGPSAPTGFSGGGG